MRNNDGQKSQGRTFSSYLRIVSSGASTVASTVRSAASAIVDRDNDATCDQVLWAGFDKLEWDGGISRKVLLLAYRSGFQVWDVQEADNVSNLVSRHDGPVSFLQLLPKPIKSKRNGDKYAEHRPLLAICADASLSEGGNAPGAINTPNDPLSCGFIPTVVWFYSLRSQSYVHVVKFRSAIFSVRCSSLVVAISQAAQIHCLDAATLEKEYTILTNPITNGCSSFGGIGYGPLAVGARWLAYSGSPVSVPNSGRVNPQHFATSANFPSSTSNGSLVAHYARESSKQIAAGIITLGDMGYRKLSRYYSELVPDGNNSSQRNHLTWKPNETVNGLFQDAENVGMVIVRDIVNKSPLAQFRAHKCPISSLCFDPSGTLLVTASIQGHNINVFRIKPGAANSFTSDSAPSYIHLYTLQRGVTNAVIQDISFSNDSHLIMISSSRGTNHLFAISPYGGPVDFPKRDIGQQNSTLQMLNKHNLYAAGPPVSLSVISRIRSGNSGWKSTVNGTNCFSGAIASVFHNCIVDDLHEGTTSVNPKYHLLVFSSGCMVQYDMQASVGQESGVSGRGSYYSAPACDSKLIAKAMQKWDICKKHIRLERENNNDIYGENENSERSKVFPVEIQEGNGGCITGRCSAGKAKINPDEKYPMFISEAELHMHEAQNPIWAKSKIYFQCMSDGGKIIEEYSHGGEIEIERIPTRVKEARRPKQLLPVCDYLQASKSQPDRISDSDNTINRQLVHQTSAMSENGILSRRGSAGSLDSMAPTTELHNGIEDTNTGRDGLVMPINTIKGFVIRSNHSPESNIWLDSVNNRASSTVEAEINPVSNNIEGHIMKSHHIMESHVQDGVFMFD